MKQVLPYDDASFDVALSLFVTCNLPSKAFTKHFQELYWVLVPGGKAILLVPTDWSHSRLYTKTEANPTAVENKITQIIPKIPRYPTTAQVIRRPSEILTISLWHALQSIPREIYFMSRTLISLPMDSQYGGRLKWCCFLISSIVIRLPSHNFFKLNFTLIELRITTRKKKGLLIIQQILPFC